MGALITKSTWEALVATVVETSAEANAVAAEPAIHSMPMRNLLEQAKLVGDQWPKWPTLITPLVDLETSS